MLTGAKRYGALKQGDRIPWSNPNSDEILILDTVLSITKIPGKAKVRVIFQREIHGERVGWIVQVKDMYEIIWVQVDKFTLMSN